MTYSWILIIVMSLMTMLIRFLPFLLLRHSDTTPGWIVYLGQVLPSAAIGMLVVYCLRNVQIMEVSSLMPALIATLLTVLVQAKSKNVVFSVLGGTICYMVMLHVF